MRFNLARTESYVQIGGVDKAWAKAQGIFEHPAVLAVHDEQEKNAFLKVLNGPLWSVPDPYDDED